MDQSILNTLKQELENAKKRHEEAKRALLRLTQPGPIRYWTGVPNSDGAQMLRNALSEERYAHAEQMAALIRVNEYMLKGTIPETSKES